MLVMNAEFFNKFLFLFFRFFFNQKILRFDIISMFAYWIYFDILKIFLFINSKNERFFYFLKIFNLIQTFQILKTCIFILILFFFFLQLCKMIYFFIFFFKKKIYWCFSFSFFLNFPLFSAVILNTFSAI